VEVMRNVLTMASGVAMIAGASLAPTGAAAQYYYYPQPQQRYYYPQPYGYNQPQFVPPRVARKQAHQYNRFVEKYGYVQPQPQYNYYRQPRPRGFYYYQ
jgi:hypothetical protein